MSVLVTRSMRALLAGSTWCFVGHVHPGLAIDYIVS